MAQVYYTGPGALWPASVALNTNTLGTSLLQMDAATEAGAFVGQVWWPDDGSSTKNLTHIGWRAGTIVFDGASQWRLSVQNVSTTTAPMQPDGVVDQHYTPAAGTAPANNTWNRNALNTSRTVTRGELLALVWEFLTFTTGDILRVASGFTTSTLYRPAQADAVFYNGTAWASTAATVNVVLEFDDGTFGTMYGAYPFSNSTTTGNYNNATTGGSGFAAGDERGIEVAVPFDMPIDGVWAELTLAGTSSDFDVVLYNDTTVLDTISADATQMAVAGNRRFFFPLPTVRVLTGGSTVRLMIKPTTANNVAITNVTLDSASHRVLHGGTAVAGVTREDGGAFSSPVTTVMPLMGFVLAGGDNGAFRGGFNQVVGTSSRF